MPGLAPALFVLAFLFLYKLGDNMATALQTPFFIDVGFTLTQIGAIAKTAGLIAAIVGGIVGGLVMVKLSINRALWVFGVVQIVSILGFALLALSEIGANPWMLGVVVAFEYLGVGLRLRRVRLRSWPEPPTRHLLRRSWRCSRHSHSCLEYSRMPLPASSLNSVGWTNFFLLSARYSPIPGMLLLFKVAPWNEARLDETAEVAVGRLDELRGPGLPRIRDR